jgi:hypothetical protein
MVDFPRWTNSGSLCAFAEPGLKQAIFYAFDPIKGKGRELTRVDIDPSDAYHWDLSPDGSRIAILKQGQGRIKIISLTAKPEQQITVKGWSGFGSLDWAADGKGLYVSSFSPSKGATLLHINLKPTSSNRRVSFKPGGTVSQRTVSSSQVEPQKPWMIGLFSSGKPENHSPEN